MAERLDELVYLNNCELFIESVSPNRKGSFYLIWKKGKKNVQSNIYQASHEDQTLYPK